MIKIISLLLLSFSVSCPSDTEPINLIINDTIFEVEIARTPEERQEGLKFRKSMDDRTGMLFIFEKDDHHTFYMKDTYLPLSIAFISKDGRILEIVDMKPLSLKSIRSTYSSRYALEVMQGAFAELGIQVGDSITLPSDFE